MNLNCDCINRKNDLEENDSFMTNNDENDIYLKIIKYILFILSIIILNIKATHIYSPYINHKKDLKDIKVCLCAIGKKENLYAKEYVQHYKNLGYNHIFLYDNNVIGDEKFEDVLHNEVNDGFVTIIDRRGLRDQQCKSYNDCYEKNNKNYDWLSFFDLDEFLYIKNNKSIQEFLSDEKYNECKNVKINMLYYTDNDFIYYENKSLNERFTKYKLDYFPNIHIKSTVRGNLSRNYWASYENPHTSKVRYSSCNTLGEKIKFNTPFNKPNYTLAYLKHFHTKTLEEFWNKVQRGYNSRKFWWNKSNYTKRFKEFFLLNNKNKEKIEFIKNRYNIVIDSE